MAFTAQRDSVMFWAVRPELLHDPFTVAEREHELKSNKPLPLAMNSISMPVSISGFSRRE